VTSAAINSLYRAAMLTLDNNMMLPTDRQASSVSIFRPVFMCTAGYYSSVNDVDDATIVMSERRLHGMVE